MFEYREDIREMSQYEEDLILTAIYNLNFKPNDKFTVYCDTTNALCIPFVATLIKRVKAECRGIGGCIIYHDKIIFGQKNKPKKT